MFVGRKIWCAFLGVFLALGILVCRAQNPHTGYDNLALGIPGRTDAVVDRPGFALGYIEYHEQAAWVIYKLTKDEVLKKAARRSNRFREDPEIPTGSAAPADYRKSGYGRGHLAPDIVKAIWENRQPVSLTLEKLRCGIPDSWAGQRKFFLDK